MSALELKQSVDNLHQHAFGDGAGACRAQTRCTSGSAHAARASQVKFQITLRIIKLITPRLVDWQAIRVLQRKAPDLWLIGLLAVLLGICTPAFAQGETAKSIPRHPMELQALREPTLVIAQLPALLASAQQKGDFAEVALLYLAQANACRVIADWLCQRKAGASAQAAAKQAKRPILQIRGLIGEARGSIALLDFYRGEQLLVEAERLLKVHPMPALLADVFLAYSTLSFDLGKLAASLEFAERGLLALKNGGDLPMQTRLLRNRARAQTQLGQRQAAQQSLSAALLLAERFSDPKLSAQLYLEIARSARQSRDFAAQYRNGEKVLELAASIKNAQLQGQAHEVLGLAALDQADYARAEKQLRTAYLAFRELKLWSDELRVLRAYVGSAVQREETKSTLGPFVARLLELEMQIDREQKAKASADFDARLKYAEAEVELGQLKSDAALAEERERMLQVRSKFEQALLLFGLVSMLAMFGFLFQQWRSRLRSQATLQMLQQSETRYRMLSDYASDLVVRMRLDDTQLYVSPSCLEMLGWQPTEFMARGVSLVHPEDRAAWEPAKEVLLGNGGPSTVVIRMRHRSGHFVIIEALARLAPSDSGGVPDIIYTGRDISVKVATDLALSESEKRLRLVADNIPALVAYIDTDQRYRFCNAMIGKVFDVIPALMLGRTMQEVGGETIYADVEQHVLAALAGQRVSFEGRGDAQDRQLYYQSEYIPDVGADGSVRGFYAMTFDITPYKEAERRLRLITDNLPALISYIDASGVFRFNNSTYEKWLNRPACEITGKHLRDVYDPATYQLIWPYIARALAGELISFELDASEGRQRHLRVNYVPETDAAGRVLGVYGLMHDISELKRSENELRLLAQFDTLTGLPNRHRFNDTFSKAIARSERNGRLMAIIFLDLDRFKNVNDTLGHQGGDEVLKEFARRLQRCVRKTDTVARLAGDEFVIILESLNLAQESETVAQKVAAEMLPAFQILGSPHTLTTSAGIAIRRSGELDGEALLRRADEALYAAKGAGRGGYFVAR